MEPSQDLVRHGKRGTWMGLVGKIVQGLVNEQDSGPEDQRIRGSEGIGVGAGTGPGPSAWVRLKVGIGSECLV